MVRVCNYQFWDSCWFFNNDCWSVRKIDFNAIFGWSCLQLPDLSSEKWGIFSYSCTFLKITKEKQKNLLVDFEEEKKSGKLEDIMKNAMNEWLKINTRLGHKPNGTSSTRSALESTLKKVLFPGNLLIHFHLAKFSPSGITLNYF